MNFSLGRQGPEELPGDDEEEEDDDAENAFEEPRD